ITETRDINVPMGGFLREADDRFDLVPVLWTFAEPGGYVTDEAFEELASRIAEAAETTPDLDGVYLDLHGAMVTRQFDDGEAEVLRRVRAAVGPDLPLAVSLDLHANTSRAFFDLASSVAIYRTYPHVDMGATGGRACQLLAAELERGAPFLRAWRQVDVIVPVPSQTTDLDPARALYANLPEREGGGVASVDMAFGFPPADVPQVGATVFAYGTEQDAVDAAADTTAQALRDALPDFDDPMVRADAAVRQALDRAKTAERPIVIADPQDNPGAGTTGDTTGLLRALVEQGASRAVIGMMWDAATAETAHAAGVGATITASIGGSFSDGGNGPFACEAEVLAVSDGRFAFSGPMFSGTARLGAMAALRLTEPTEGAGITIVVGSNRAQTADLAILTHLGLDPTSFDIVCVKSANHFRAAFAPIADQILYAEAPGANPCDPARIAYTRLRPGVQQGLSGKTSA
ncbi:MAG: M81 family metallopeptidase, partial [Pseudomonadota bacterium]